MFITVGRKYGHCGHEHENFEEAQECLSKFTQDLRNKGKISDRIIVEVDSIDQLEEEMEIY